MIDSCQHKMKSGKRKGKPCGECAFRTADGEYAARVKGGEAVFCELHSPPMPPPMLDDMLWDLETSIQRAIGALADVPDDTLRAAIAKVKKEHYCGFVDGDIVRPDLSKALDKLKKRLDIKPATGDGHHDMRNGVRVKGSHDPLWQEIEATPSA